jgi:outer membrane protein assembly factor BamB
VTSFGKLFECPVDGQVYAQPLYVPMVDIPGHGTHNVLYVATMNNKLYAFDADVGTLLWTVHVDNKAPVPSGFFKPDYLDISNLGRRFIGILATPVIDAKIDANGKVPTTGTLYLTLFTTDINVGTDKIDLTGKQFHQLLYAIDIRTGTKVALAGGHNPVEIGGEVPGVGYLSKPQTAPPGQPHMTIKTDQAGVVFVGGQPPGSDFPVALNGHDVQIADGVTVAGVDHVRFNPMQHMQRPGLLLHDGNLYVCFGSHGDFRPYHGWVFVYAAATLVRQAVICTSPNGGEAGVWQAGEGPVVAKDGSVLVGTGNGDTSLPGVPQTGNFGESFLRIGKNAQGAFVVTGSFNPFVDRELPANHGQVDISAKEDDDLGAAAPTLLPDGFAVGGGKDGIFYLVDPSQFPGQPTRDSSALLQSFNASYGAGTQSVPAGQDPTQATHHIHGSPVVWKSPERGTLVFIWGENDVVRAYRYDDTQHEFPTQPRALAVPGNQDDPANRTTPDARGDHYASADIDARNGMPGGILSISANAQQAGSGILWGSTAPFGNGNRQVVDGELVAYDASRWDVNDPNNPPRLVRIWSSLQHPVRDSRSQVRGAIQPGSELQLHQFAKFCPPTIAAGRVYLATFNQPGAVYAYGRLAQANGGYNLGFGGSIGLSLNGSARVNQDESISLLQIEHKFQAASVFATQARAIAAFHCKFQVFVDPNSNADGFTFTIQGQGPRALGGQGSGLGFGPNQVDIVNPGYAIRNSVAIKFALFNNLQRVSQTAVYTRGAFPVGNEEGTGNVDLRSGHPLDIAVDFDGQSQLKWSLTDTINGFTSAHNASVPIAAIVGPNGWFGFTGGSGFQTATVTLRSWQLA